MKELKVKVQRKTASLRVKKNPVVGRRLRLDFNGFTGFSYLEKVKYRRSARKLEKVVNSKEFKDIVLGLRFTFTSLTSKEVYDMIMTGQEHTDPKIDYKMDINVEIYYENNNTIGYMYEGDPRTWINRMFFEKYTDGEVAANIFHEWLHQQGFNHEHDQDYDSVPYKLGYLVEEMIGKHDEGKLNLTDLYPIKRRKAA